MSVTPALNYLANFDGVALTSVTGLSVLRTNPYVIPKRKLGIFDIARTNRSKNPSGFFTERLVTVTVGLGRDKRGDLEQSIDTLMALLQGLEKELVLSQSGGVRKYYCSLSDTVFRRAGGSSCEIDLIFACTDRFGYDTAYKTFLSLTGITASPRTDAVTFLGSAAWQVPQITITYTALTGGTAKTVQVANNANGQTLSINRTWTAGDRIDIDAYAGTVKVNGVEVAWTGAIPEFAPGLGTFVVSDGFTTRTFNLTGTYYPRWL